MVQPSEIQVQRSMVALLQGGDRARSEDDHDHLGDLDPLAPEVTRRIAEAPPVRSERVAAARARLDRGDEPSADEVADKLVGRLVCDRLR